MHRETAVDDQAAAKQKVGHVLVQPVLFSQVQLISGIGSEVLSNTSHQLKLTSSKTKLVRVGFFFIYQDCSIYFCLACICLGYTLHATRKLLHVLHNDIQMLMS
jgi:hypothetical protein